MTVLTVTLNAAIDKRYDVAAFTVGEVQRVSQVRAGAGGKGLNVARGARLCGQDVVATGFVAGFAGQFITSQVEAQGVREEFVRVPGESRTCINIIDAAGNSTEFLEPGATVDATQLASLLARFEGLLGEVDVVTLSGSAPSGCPDDVYVPFIEAARLAGCPVILDTSCALLLAALGAGPTVASRTGRNWRPFPEPDWPTSPPSSQQRAPCAPVGPEWVVVSLGADGAVAVNDRKAVQVLAPRVKALNPVGCGDVLSPALPPGWLAGWPSTRHFRSQSAWLPRRPPTQKPDTSIPPMRRPCRPPLSRSRTEGRPC